jgi:16S rRNA (uracil1498-N3)-methyltransferase
VFLIGPEGDFSENEVSIALQNGYQAVSLSDFRLRTETAALISVMKLSLI